MQTPADGAGACVGTVAVFAETPRIVPSEHTERKLLWRRICRACRSPEDQKLVDAQLKRLAAYAGNNVVEFPRRA